MDEVGAADSVKLLGQHLQAARKAAGLTQQELCQHAGLSYSTLAKIERGAIQAPSVFTIQSIAQALGTTLDELIGTAGPHTAAQQVPEQPPQSSKKRSKSGVRFVYFDVNGCLVRFFHRAFTQIASDTGVPSDVIETAFWHYNDSACRGEINLDEFNRLFAERIGVETLDWQQYYLAAVDPINEMHPLLTWAAEHYKVGLLTNIMPGFVEAMLAAGLLPNVPYHAVIDSSQVGVIKPEPRIYEIATEKSGVQPGEILLVDDSRSNLMAAEKFGWHVLWFDDFRPEDSIKRISSSLEPETPDKPDAQVPDTSAVFTQPAVQNFAAPVPVSAEAPQQPSIVLSSE